MARPRRRTIYLLALVLTMFPGHWASAQLGPETPGKPTPLQSLLLGPDPIGDVPLSPAALLEEVLAADGKWEQMCGDVLPPLQPRVPLFGYERKPTHYIAPENLGRLRDQREGVLAALGLRLTGLISAERARIQQASARMGQVPATTPGPAPGDPQVLLVDYGDLGDDSALDQCLMILLDLNGIEALPDLLKLEAAMDEVALYRTEPGLLEAIASKPWNPASIGATKMHARVLSVITALLRNEHYAPFLDSSIYQHYAADFAALLEAQAKEPGLIVFNEEPVTIPPENADTIAALIHLRDHDPARFGALFSVPYDQASRGEIVHLATTFLAKVKPVDYTGRRGMSKRPVPR